MFSIDIDRGQAEKDFAIAELWEAGSTGIVELEDLADIARMRAFFDDDSRQAEVIAQFGGEAQPADTRDWVAFAREHLKPMKIGERIFVIPEWCDDPTPEGRFRIVINAGLAFGTGAHETTRLCLEAIERHVRPGMTVVDIGTGSGILCEAALKLGAARAVASDTDPDAVAVAKENFKRAGVSVGVFTGSADAVGSGVADVIVANISPAWIAELASDWVRILKPGGVGILSGFEAADVPGVSAAIEKAGGLVRGVFGDGEWRMVEMGSPLPSVRARVTMLPGLTRPRRPNQGRYMPHIVIGDPWQRAAHVNAANEGTEYYLGVHLTGAPDELHPGQSADVTLVLMYWPRVDYSEVVRGATFTVREGGQIVGFGHIVSTI